MTGLAEPLFTLREVSVRAGEAVLLDGVSFDVRVAGITALVGPSGAGKTTVLRVLTRLVDPIGGGVTYRGRALESWPAPALRRRVQLVVAAPVLLTGTVATELRLANPDLSPEHATVLLDGVGLPAEIFLDRATAGLSAGQVQRLCLARSLALDPDVLLLDEPTTHVDATATALVEAAVAGFVATGGTAVVVSHDEAQVARLADAVVTLDAGRSGEATERGVEGN